MDIKKVIDDNFESMVELRRYMHQYPEVSFQEENTKAWIYEQIKDLGIDIRENVGGNGIVARLQVNDSYETVAIRADFDALPIQDEKDVPYRSKTPGVMHACGHDAHTAMLITMAKVLSAHKEELPVNVVFLHQHAEELLPGGAKAMIEDGALENVDYVIGTHVSTKFPVGTIKYNYDTMYANADSFKIVVNGLGGHGATPQVTKDPIIASASLIQQIQTIVSRSVSPLDSAVVSIGAYNAGSVFNVIPGKAEIKGTFRTFTEEVRQIVAERLEQLCMGISASFNVHADIEITYGYPSLKNDHELLDYVIDNVREDSFYVKDVEEVGPAMGGEDFSYFAENRPGCYFYTGVRNSDKKADTPHHHPHFDIDEDGMKTGVETMLKAVLNFNKK
ncbi:M20 metallopeptidase family protein [Jeotgalicoccus marinus]|uniref:M20 metallopeptidase family protein n=1 Tax=Jeotgalicoccus marinus TaxID=516700 RepID=UPI000421D877|nr:amidohydrolase [Jeotgalicoccus marinus]